MNLELPRTIAVQKAATASSAAENIFSYEYCWQNTSYYRITIQIDFTVSEIYFSQPLFLGWFNFVFPFRGLEVKFRSEGN